MDYDLIICGAGPAGLSAAKQASKHGLRVALIDEQTHAGGQIYRDVERVDEDMAKILGEDYVYGRTLVNLPESVEYYNDAKIWHVEKTGKVAFSRRGKTEFLQGEKVLLATGALERPVPIEGWTLPGVMTVGGAQILLKSSGIIPENAVLVGSGPLIYLFAAQLVRAGHPPRALIETQTNRNLLKATFHPLAALAGKTHIAKGLALIGEIKAANVKRYTACKNIRVVGDPVAQNVEFSSHGKTYSVPTHTVLLHEGVVPNNQITRMLGLDHEWNNSQNCFIPRAHENGQSSDEKFYIAGDGAGIVGAIGSAAAGAIAGLSIAKSLGKIIDQNELKVQKAKLDKEKSFRPFLDALYAPSKEVLNPPDNVCVCRCEEVKAGVVRVAVQSGAQGPNQVKALTRAGMGPCQGRYCGLTMTQILVEETGRDFDEIGYFKIRPPIKPISLGELANLERKDDD